MVVSWPPCLCGSSDLTKLMLGWLTRVKLAEAARKARFIDSLSYRISIVAINVRGYVVSRTGEWYELSVRFR